MCILKVNAIFSLLPLNYYVGEGHSIIVAMDLHMLPNNDLPLSSFQAKIVIVGPKLYHYSGSPLCYLCAL